MSQFQYRVMRRVADNRHVIEFKFEDGKWEPLTGDYKSVEDAMSMVFHLKIEDEKRISSRIVVLTNEQLDAIAAGVGTK